MSVNDSNWKRQKQEGFVNTISNFIELHANVKNSDDEWERHCKSICIFGQKSDEKFYFIKRFKFNNLKH